MIVQMNGPYSISNFFILLFKGAEATCVKIATQMKKCSRLKEMKFSAHINML